MREVHRKSARATRRVDEHERAVGSARPLHARHRTRRRLVVRPAVRVDALFGARNCNGARFGLDDRRLPEMRRVGRSLRELRRELAERQVLRLLLDQAERRDVPERRRATVAEHDLVAVGRAEQRREPLADTSYDALHTLLAVRRPEVRRPGGRERGELLRTHLRRAGPEPPVTRAQLSRDHEIGVAHPPILSDPRCALRYRADHDHVVYTACRGRGPTEVGMGLDLGDAVEAFDGI